MKQFLFIFFTTTLLLFACKKETNEPIKIISNCPDSSANLSYSVHIVPIINASCGNNVGACHNSSSTFGNFNSYQGFTSHPPSHIIHCVKQDDPTNYYPMPLGASKLSSCDIAKIVNWVNQGEKNN